MQTVAGWVIVEWVKIGNDMIGLSRQRIYPTAEDYVSKSGDYHSAYRLHLLKWELGVHAPAWITNKFV